MGMTMTQKILAAHAGLDLLSHCHSHFSIPPDSLYVDILAHFLL